MRRGLTLIEVVVAAALLALIVAACLPVLAGARRGIFAARAAALSQPADDLDGAVDELLRQRPGLIRDLLDQPTLIHLRWTVGDRDFEADARLAAQVAAAENERRSSHAWAVFRMEGVEIPRWLRVPSVSPPQEPTP